MNRPIHRCTCPPCEWYGHDEDEPTANVGDEYEPDQADGWEPELKPEDDYVNPCAAVLMGALLILSSGLPRAAVAAETWVTVGIASYHFDRSAGYNERNIGVGIEHDFNSDHAVSAGAYRNSINRVSRYALYRWTPIHVGHVRIGVLAGAVDGYHRNGGGIAPAFAPTLTLDTRPIGISLIVIPGVSNDVSTAVGLQAKLRF